MKRFTPPTNPVPMNIRRELRAALKRKPQDYRFTHFVTLSSNGAAIRHERMRELLRQWDARVNRALVGPRWWKYPDERLVWYAFLEKAEVNPHWHLLVQTDPAYGSPSQLARVADLPKHGEKAWLDLLPKGSFDCQAVASNDVINYVLKEVSNPHRLERFVIHREFIP